MHTCTKNYVVSNLCKVFILAILWKGTAWKTATETNKKNRDLIIYIDKICQMTQFPTLMN